jgi:ribosome-associated protein
LRIAQLLHEKQVTSIAILDVSGPLVIADYFLLGTVSNTRQGQAIAKELDADVKRSRGHRRRNVGGMESEDSNWVLLDFDDVVVHLFLAEARAYYSLEDLWADAPRLPFTPSETPMATADTKVHPRPHQVRILPGPGDSPAT